MKLDLAKLSLLVDHHNIIGLKDRLNKTTVGDDLNNKKLI